MIGKFLAILSLIKAYAWGMVVVGVVLWWWVSRGVLECMFGGIFWSLRRMVKYLGSSLLDICVLHTCGIGLMAMINAYCWWRVG